MIACTCASTEDNYVIIIEIKSFNHILWYFSVASLENTMHTVCCTQNQFAVNRIYYNSVKKSIHLYITQNV